MFFIPIFAIFLVIWYCVFVVQSVRGAKFDAEMKRLTRNAEKLSAEVHDSDLVARAERELRYVNKYTVIQEYMGGGAEWEDFARETGSDTLFSFNLAVLMIPYGKLPETITMRHHSHHSLYRLTKEEWGGMQEDLLLKFEDTLNRRGIGVRAMCQDGFPNTGKAIPIRERVAREGRGCTYGNRDLWFEIP